MFCLLLTLSQLPGSAQPSAPVPALRPVAAQTVRPDPYTPHVPPRAIAYQRSGRILGLCGIAWGLLGLWLLLRTGLSARLRRAVFRWLRLAPPSGHADSPPPFRAVAGYVIVYSLLLLVWMLPFRIAGLALEYHFGFSHVTALEFVGDLARDAVFGLVDIPLIWAGYWLLARSPRRWWLWLWALLVPLLFLQIVLYPVVVAPVYNRFTPLAPGPLRDKILGLAAKAGITGGRVFVEDTSRRTDHVNAYVTGVGPTTRIVINDTALRQLPEDELLAMVGHEMGHYVEGHVWIEFATGILGAGAFLWIASWLLPWMVRRWGPSWGLWGLSDLAALPLVMLTVRLFLLAQAPIENAESRYLEHRADAFGLRVTHLNDAMARLFVRFAERDFSDPNPPAWLQFWFGTHPTLSERIAFARPHPGRTGP